MPGTNREFWQEKFRKNMERDGRAQAALREAGWRVIVVWECEVKDLDALTARLRADLDPRFLFYVFDFSPDRMAAEEGGDYRLPSDEQST